MGRLVRGLFITGTDTDVGKTYVGAIIARAVAASGRRVGVYKPAASGCRHEADRLVSEDAITLWRAAGQPGELDRVCPQMFAAPLAPHLAALSEGKQLDSQLLREGLKYWLERSEMIIIEGAGGLMSPLGEDEYVADLAYEFAFPLVVVVENRIGAINRALQTLITAATFRDGLEIAGVVLNQTDPGTPDDSTLTNRLELGRRAVPPVLGEIAWQQADFEPPLDWWNMARPAPDGLSTSAP